MEITPAIFEAQDQYHDSMVAATRRLVVAHGYGLVPGAELNVTTSIVDEVLSLQVFALEAVSKSGGLLQIAGDSMSRKQPHAKGRACFVVVHPDGEVEQEVNQVLYSKPRYAYDFCTLDEMDDDSFPIAKLVQEFDSWKVQELYIPPCMTVGAHAELFRMQQQTSQMVHEIAGIMKDRHVTMNYTVLDMLLMDWDELDGTETPKEYYLLLKKTAWFLSAQDVAHLTLPKLPPIPPFNNNDILESVSVEVQYLSDYRQAVNVEEEPEKVEPEEEDVIVYDGIIP